MLVICTSVNSVVLKELNKANKIKITLLNQTIWHINLFWRLGDRVSLSAAPFYTMNKNLWSFYIIQGYPDVRSLQLDFFLFKMFCCSSEHRPQFK